MGFHSISILFARTCSWRSSRGSAFSTMCALVSATCGLVITMCTLVSAMCGLVSTTCGLVGTTCGLVPRWTVDKRQQYK